MLYSSLTARVIARLELSQPQANILHHAIDEYFHARPFDDLAHDMYEKVADALVAAGYEPGYTQCPDVNTGTGSDRHRPPHP